MINKDNLTFGKRMGFEPIDNPIQINGISNLFRTDLWNAYYLFIQNPIENADRYKSNVDNICKITWINYFRRPIDDYPDSYKFGHVVRDYIVKVEWYKTYEFFERILPLIQEDKQFDYEGFVTYLNTILKENNAAYILHNNKFIPITNDTELEEIKRLQIKSEEFSLIGIQKHLDSALKLLSHKPEPDFRNSIKESISMVEVISRLIEPNENSLGKALNRLEKKEKINKNLKAGFEKLYAYTNDRNGIRHALMDQEQINIEDARFFLVSCSAFTNYLIEKAIKNNILPKEK